MSPAVAAVAEAATAKKSVAEAQKKTPSHPPFAKMIKDVIVVLKERDSSSQVAIHKFIEEKYKHLPTTFRKLLQVQLKCMVASGKLVKVKHSFKLAPSSKLASTKPKSKAKESAVTTKGTTAAKEKKSDAAGVKKRKAAEPRTAGPPRSIFDRSRLPHGKASPRRPLRNGTSRARIRRLRSPRKA